MEQIKLKGRQEELESDLLKEAVSTPPKFSSNSEALATLSKELEQLTAKLGRPVSEILRIRETASEFNEIHERVASIVRQIALLKR